MRMRLGLGWSPLHPRSHRRYDDDDDDDDYTATTADQLSSTERYVSPLAHSLYRFPLSATLSPQRR